MGFPFPSPSALFRFITLPLTLSQSPCFSLSLPFHTLDLLKVVPFLSLRLYRVVKERLLVLKERLLVFFLWLLFWIKPSEHSPSKSTGMYSENWDFIPAWHFIVAWHSSPTYGLWYVFFTIVAWYSSFFHEFWLVTDCFHLTFCHQNWDPLLPAKCFWGHKGPKLQMCTCSTAEMLQQAIAHTIPFNLSVYV